MKHILKFSKDMGLQNILESQLGELEEDRKDQMWQLMQLVALHNQQNQKLGRVLALPVAVPMAAIGSCSMPLCRDPPKEAHLHPERCGDGLGPETGVLTHLDQIC